MKDLYLQSTSDLAKHAALPHRAPQQQDHPVRRAQSWTSLVQIPSWSRAGDPGPGVAAKDVRALVGKGAFVIFDGLDQVGVHLLPSGARMLLARACG